LQLTPGAFDPIGVAGGQDQVGALFARQSSRLEPDPGAAGDDDDGLAGERGGDFRSRSRRPAGRGAPVWSVRRRSCSRHGRLRE
jgi:hypothetical protein